ncbi:MAG: prenyltransferase/squalene oxidase repeat-containing protein [Gemmataceae bacterium]
MRPAATILITSLLVLVQPTNVWAEAKIDKKTQKAVDKALKWLSERQNDQDGSWSDPRYPHNTAITSFALMAFMSQGHLPGQGFYGPEVAKGARFLMAAQRKSDGYLVGARGGNMYCHGMATLALAELWGSTGDKQVKPVVQKAVDLIVRSQYRDGGWRYEPRPSGSDISVTIMQVMALRAARNGGLHVPDKTLTKAINYIKSCYDKRSGGFTYQPRNRAPGFARTAAGTCVLYLTGKYDAKEIKRAVGYMQKNYGRRRSHYWYGLYYAAHAMHQVGGKEWDAWYRKMTQELLPKQSNNGSWSRLEGTRVGPVYQTSIAVIILSVPAHYLPIFQR